MDMSYKNIKIYKIRNYNDISHTAAIIRLITFNVLTLSLPLSTPVNIRFWRH